MKTSWKWLGEWVELSGITPEEVAERLTLAGLESEEIERIGQGMDAIVVGQITAIEPHPKADRLVVCQVDAGEGALRQIVCGATNMKVGDQVPVALPGSQPPAFDFVIGERKMRGVESRGMLCSGAELGMDDGVDGLLILPAGLTPGEPVFEALGLKDVILHWGVTPNRADCTSHRGIAREIAALFGRELRPLSDEAAALTRAEGEVTALCGLRVEDHEGCPRYAMAIMEDVEVAPSPDWLVKRLASVGLRSVNNVVDVTNYICFDLGQPLHVFDLDKLSGPALVVRRARDGESLRGLNHKDYVLVTEDLVIADAQGPVALAGVMGGEGSEVTEQTRRIVIECACFDPVTVRRSARRTKLHTDSSHRFERGVDVGATRAHLERAVAMMRRVAGAGARVVQGMGWAEREAAVPLRVALPVELSRRVLGAPLDAEQVIAALAPIGFACELTPGGATIEVDVPTWRPDVYRPIDLVEEVARQIGFDAIEGTLPAGVMGRAHEARADERALPQTILSHATLDATRVVREQLLAQGLSEVVNFSFMGRAELDALGVSQDDVLREARVLLNPLAEEVGLMRTTLWTGLLRNLETNLAQRRADVAIFELGRRYLAEGSEPETLSILVAGQARQHWSGARAWDFYDLKGLVEDITRSARLEHVRWEVPSPAIGHLHPGVQAVWRVGDRELARVGRLHPAVEQQRGLPVVYLAQVNWAHMLELGEVVPRYEGLWKFPSVTRDFALVQARDATFAVIEAALEALRVEDARLGELLKDVRLFDVYQGDRIDADKRSVAVQVTLRAEDRTLTDEEITLASVTLVEGLSRLAGVTLRS